MQTTNWRQGAWIALVCAWTIIGVGMASDASVRINGVQVGAAMLLAILFWSLRRRRSKEEKTALLEWLVLATFITTLATLDYRDIQARGLVLNVSPVVILLLGAFRSRR